ncbi:MAG: hypothetical protein HQL49_05900 [Gammaproteobacteria bacterium]|nr:hypothetical protein [Gammaproteobacteria bacterium]
MTPTDSNHNSPPERDFELPRILIDRLKESTLRVVIWGYIGILYGMIFALVLGVLQPFLPPLPLYLIAGTLSSAVAALIYGSMRLTVIVALFASIYSVIMLVIAEGAINPLQMGFGALLCGAIVGAAFGRLAHHSRIGLADAKAITGLVSGFIVSLLYVTLSLLTPLPLASHWMVAVLCPVVGIIYTRLVPTFIRIFSKILTPVGDGMLVAITVSLLVTTGLWLMSTSINPDLAGDYLPLLLTIEEHLSLAVTAGMLSGMIGGFISTFVWREWQEL